MKKNKLSSLIMTIIMIIVIIVLFNIFKSHYFNGFIKAETTVGISEFRRDNDVKYSDMDSYKIISPTQNDAAFYKEIQVEPHTPYRITCMVKTENVIPDAINTDGGACISIIEAAEISKSIRGTSEWQQLELMFNSQNRTTIKLGFRLGGNSGKAQGTAWFSDFKLEKGINLNDSNWKAVCFIFENTDVEINGERMNFSMSLKEKQNIKNDMEDFKISCKRFSGGKITIDYDICDIAEPLTTVSYSEEHGYYFDPYDVNKLIEDIVLQNNYDYIFCAIKMGDEEKEIPVNNWVGLGSMDLYGIGFSNIRFADEKTNVIHNHNYIINTFSEEVFMHEFLHTLERTGKEHGYNVIDLHDYEKYGYDANGINGLAKWYEDYLECTIVDPKTKQNQGLNDKIYTYKPVNESNFTFPIELNFNKEPSNIFEEVKSLFAVIEDAI